MAVALPIHRLLRALRGLSLAFVAAGIAVSLLGGDALADAVGRGIVVGGLGFVRIAVPVAAVVLAYWLGRRSAA